MFRRPVPPIAKFLSIKFAKPFLSRNTLSNFYPTTLPSTASHQHYITCITLNDAEAAFSDRQLYWQSSSLVILSTREHTTRHRFLDNWPLTAVACSRRQDEAREVKLCTLSHMDCAELCCSQARD